jgi:hypothetical protein
MSRDRRPPLRTGIQPALADRTPRLSDSDRGTRAPARPGGGHGMITACPPQSPANRGRRPLQVTENRSTATLIRKARRRLPTDDSGDEIALLGGIDMLLEPSDLPVGEGPHVRNLHFGGLAGAVAVPGVDAEAHHSVALGDQLSDID